MGLTIRLLCLALASVLARSAIAQSPARPPAAVNPVGVWRGTSTCLVRPSPCNDEIVVYRIAATKGDSLTVDARKIVRGVEEEMAVLDCAMVSPNSQLPNSQLRCAIPRGVWSFSVRGDSLAGELRLLDDTRFRVVRAARVP